MSLKAPSIRGTFRHIFRLPSWCWREELLVMHFLRRVPWLVVAAAGLSNFLPAQDLAPRAYVITPVHSNAITLTWGFYSGGLNFSGTIPVTATGTYNVPIFTYYHSLSF